MNPDPTSLDRLHDIVAPPPAPWWPPAPGWYWVMGVLAVLLCVALVRRFLVWQRNCYRREALAEWRRQEPRLRDKTERASALAALAELLKRTALSAFPREEVAALTGAKWLAFLNRTGAAMEFPTNVGALLESAAYDPPSVLRLSEEQVTEASGLVRRWLKHHRAGKAGRC
jgi:hypothetical protein